MVAGQSLIREVMRTRPAERVSQKSWCCQSAYHQSNHGDADHGFAGFDENLVIFTHSTKASQPGKGSLYDPTMVQQLETLGVIRSLHNLQSPGAKFFRPIHQLSRVSAVSPDLL